MDHPGEAQLQRYLDAELDIESEERIRAHLRVCDDCRARIEADARASALVRATMPDPAAFASEGEFWLRVSRRLEETRPAPRWPLVPFLPPVLLAALGSALHVTLLFIVSLSTLIWVGVLPSPGRLVTAGLPELRAPAWLAETVLPWLGWSDEEVVGTVTARWQALGPLAQDAIVISVGAAAILAALSAIVVLYVTWAWCWPGVARRQTQGGN